MRDCVGIKREKRLCLEENFLECILLAVQTISYM